MRTQGDSRPAEADLLRLLVGPAAGDDHSAVRLTPAELEMASYAEAWVDVCKGWNEVQ